MYPSKQQSRCSREMFLSLSPLLIKIYHIHSLYNLALVKASIVQMGMAKASVAIWSAILRQRRPTPINTDLARSNAVCRGVLLRTKSSTNSKEAVSRSIRCGRVSTIRDSKPDAKSCRTTLPPWARLLDLAGMVFPAHFKKRTSRLSNFTPTCYHLGITLCCSKAKKASIRSMVISGNCIRATC